MKSQVKAGEVKRGKKEYQRGQHESGNKGEFGTRMIDWGKS